MNPTNNFRAPMMGETVWFVCKKCGHRFSEKTKKRITPMLASTATTKCPKCGGTAKYDNMTILY